MEFSQLVTNHYAGESQVDHERLCWEKCGEMMKVGGSTLEQRQVAKIDCKQVMLGVYRELSVR